MLNRLTIGLVLTLSSAASGQTIVNGDFENGLQNWAVSGFAVSTRLEPFRCGRAFPSSTAFGVDTVSGQALTLRFVPLLPRSNAGARFIDIATCDTRPIEVDFYLDTRTWKTVRIASPGPNLVHRESVPLDVSISGQRDYFLFRVRSSGSLQKPSRIYFDNLRYHPIDNDQQLPINAGLVRGRLDVGATARLTCSLRSRALVAGFLSTRPLATPIPIPGYVGLLRIDLQQSILLFARFETGGFSVDLPVPNNPDLRGAAIAIQYAAFNGATNIRGFSNILVDRIEDPRK